MPKWIDDDHIDGEMPDELFLAAVNDEMLSRVEREGDKDRGRYGNDGLVSVYQEQFTHHGVVYKLYVRRYFAVRREWNGTFPMQADLGWNRIHKDVVLEGDEPPTTIKDLLGLSGLLWRDTCHFDQKEWTLRQMWEYMAKAAEDDIAVVHSLPSLFEQKVCELRETLDLYLASLDEPMTEKV